MTTHTLNNDHHHDMDTTDIFGFWIYILSDCILFACLFAAYAVLHNNVYGGPSMRMLINIPSIFNETIILLVSSFTYGMAVLSSYKNNIYPVILWLGITMMLGAFFVGMEINEFTHLYQ